MVRIPEKPPTFESLLGNLAQEAKVRATKHAFRAGGEAGYHHWDELKRRQPPAGLSHQEWWLAIMLRRLGTFNQVELLDRSGVPFQYALPAPIPEFLHRIDLSAGGRLELADPSITDPEMKDRYYLSSLIEEAVTSSQLEGATTTRAAAVEMLRSNRSPRSKSERMILNNFAAMREIAGLKDRPLDVEMLLGLHRTLTAETMEDPGESGRFRRAGDAIKVYDQADMTRVLHDPPPAGELDARIDRLCRFANGETPAGFVHPVIRSIILHFWVAYDHPFTDGNGRMARALFYWSMLRHGYWLFEFLSISTILRKAPAKYALAYLHSETDNNDLTYFILYQLGVIERSVEELKIYIRTKTEEVRSVEAKLQDQEDLNHRQLALLGHALRHPAFRYTVESHRVSHNVVYQTARTDLLDLAEQGFLVSRKIGKKLVFTPAPNLPTRLGTATPSAGGRGRRGGPG